jgi:MFS family permease
LTLIRSKLRLHQQFEDKNPSGDPFLTEKTEFISIHIREGGNRIREERKNLNPECFHIRQRAINMAASGRSSILVLSLLLLAHAIEHTYGAIMPVLFPLIMDEFSLNYAQIGLLAASYMITLSFLQLFAGLLTRYIVRKILIGAGLIWVGLTTFATGFARGFQELVGIRALSGAGASMYHPLSGSFLADRFGRSSRGRMMGLHLGAGNVGSTVAPVLAGCIVLTLGWRATLYVFAVPGLLAGIAFWLLVREGTHVDTKMVSVRTSLFKVLKKRETLVLIFVETLLSFRSSGVGTFLPAYLTRSLGFEVSVAAAFFSAMYAGSIPGPLALGYLSDHLGRKKVVFCANIVSALAIWLLIVGASPGLILLNLLVLGIAAYSVPAIIQAFLGDVTDPVLRDAAYSAFFAISMTFGYGLAPAVIGLVIDRFGFLSTFGFLGFISILAALLVLSVNEGLS